MNNIEIRKAAFLNNEEVDIEGEKKGVKVFTNKDNDTAYITDDKGEILFKIEADCNQNYGFLKIIN